MTRRTALRIIVFAAVIGLAAQALLLDNLLGVNAPLLATALLGAAFVLRPRDRRMDPLDWWLPPTALAMSAAIALRADPTLLLLDLGPACGLLGASIAALAGEAVTRRSAVRVVELALLVLGWAGIGILRTNQSPPPATQLPGPTWMQAMIAANPTFLGRQLNMASQSWDGQRLYFSSSLLANWDKGGEDNEQFVKAYAWNGKELTPRFDLDFTALKLGRPHHMLFGAKNMGSGPRLTALNNPPQ